MRLSPRATARPGFAVLRLTCVVATVADEKLMREVVGDEVLIKAGGGVNWREFACELIDAGADRIGTSNGIALVTRGERRRRVLIRRGIGVVAPKCGSRPSAPPPDGASRASPWRSALRTRIPARV